MRGYTSMHMSDFFCSLYCLPVVQVINMGNNNRSKGSKFPLIYCVNEMSCNLLPPLKLNCLQLKGK